jgi:DNA-binding response OmpR family regulator
MKNFKSVLIVEDEKPTAKVLEDKFRMEGFETAIAEDGAEGLRMSLENKPDLIILDILMPKMDGLEMMEELRKDPWGSRVPIIILTNLNADDKVMSQIIKDQPSYYLMKTDWKLSDVIERAKKVFEMS